LQTVSWLPLRILLGKKKTYKYEEGRDLKLGVVMHTYHSCYSENRYRSLMVQGQSEQRLAKTCLEKQTKNKKTGGVAQL
jgi:hypothetical protein